jgi:SRSO17 transposase
MEALEWTGTHLRWGAELNSLKERLGPIFGRRELREVGSAFIDGLLSGAERKTGWLMAEAAGLERPWRMQGLLGRSSWSADGLRDLVRSYVLETLADPAGVLVVDETGFVKKGDASVGVARQYSGTAGRIENSQIGVFLAYASRWGQVLIDRRLYLPKSWAADAARRTKASVPADIEFATKLELAADMIGEALDAGVSCAWVLADAVYGSDSKFRRMLQARGQPYVLAVKSSHTLRFVTQEEVVIRTDPVTIAQGLQDGDWTTLPAGEGTKGLRLHDWATHPLWREPVNGFTHSLLFRRNRRNPEQLVFYFAFAPVGTTLADLAGAAGLRWTIEECFERAKDDLGLDHCEARSWHGWHRHISLVMAAAAFLARLSAQLRISAQGKSNQTSPQPIAA